MFGVFHQLEFGELFGLFACELCDDILLIDFDLKYDDWDRILPGLGPMSSPNAFIMNSLIKLCLTISAKLL